MPPGPFYMGNILGTAVNVIALVLIVFFDIMFCFPYALPATESGMNYNSVILVGVVVLSAIWWFIYPIRNYEGPKLAAAFAEEGVEERRRLSKV